MLARLACSSASFLQKVTDVASPLARSIHQCPWLNPGRTGIDGAFTTLKMELYSSIFSGLTWIVTTRASMRVLLLAGFPCRLVALSARIWCHVTLPAALQALGQASSREVNFSATEFSRRPLLTY